ncbi:ParA family protein [Dictyobacter arantiisoli]|uniref:Sporulation initiation inhibitor protein Soj n=1 Tax=Dictyobacter arantiisoli TaxID=2014874 RepID=A0A5A5THN8_9CHLR|nr:ParA family protein [Dictyobacter arantiisoli]GCF10877.1 sporulation initiation inhibitor protein Soj [Dictyobacter arantiisoli]
MPIYCLTSIKGGVTKTTTTVNIAHGLAQTGRRVLVIDADHQCNATLALLGGAQEAKAGTFYEVMMDRRPVSEVIQRTKFENLDIVPGSMWLSNANTTLASAFGRETILQKALENVSGYHYILIDTPPNTELITVNCWVASDHLVVPLTPSWFAMFGIRILEIQLADIQKQTGRTYSIFGVVIALDDHTSKSQTRMEQIREYFGAKVFTSVIPKNVKVEMATDEAEAIYNYAPGSTGANAYAQLVSEFIQRSEGGA